VGHVSVRYVLRLVLSVRRAGCCRGEGGVMADDAIRSDQRNGAKYWTMVEMVGCVIGLRRLRFRCVGVARSRGRGFQLFLQLIKTSLF
jgi:hypothetical protein